jgi:predicted DNA-binding antitoxin AbrB/MazE fold protein
MSEHIQAIYENGILRPLQPLDLPENTVYEFDKKRPCRFRNERNRTSRRRIQRL